VADFSPGLRLNADFYAQVVGPALAVWPHAAARLGTGSEVLGFDSARSTDHGFGPRLVVFVDRDVVGEAQEAVEGCLPETFAGWPVRYGWDEVPVRHHVTVTTLGAWLADQLGVDVTAGSTTTDWLLMPQQKLLEVTRGAVYRDDPGQLSRVRERLAWYPQPVWMWMLACQWRRVTQEEAFVGRAAEVGDELGSRLLAARLARELMRLWFLLARTYWPYTKWFGSAFRALPDSQPLGRALEAAVAADDHPGREAGLVAAYETVARRHNDLGVTVKVEPTTRPFYGRPYRVLMAERFVEACFERVDDPLLGRLPLVGSVDQVAGSTDLLSEAGLFRRLGPLYQA
jgi:hypothetical protein